MLRVRLHGLVAMQGPDEELVVVPAAGEELMVGRPLQPAHLQDLEVSQLMPRPRMSTNLLLVRVQAAHGREGRVGLAQVAHGDRAVARARRHELAVPRDAADARLVCEQRVHASGWRRGDVPHLEEAFARADAQVGALQ